jgi:hypothetical protein
VVSGCSYCGGIAWSLTDLDRLTILKNSAASNTVMDCPRVRLLLLLPLPPDAQLYTLRRVSESICAESSVGRSDTSPLVVGDEASVVLLMYLKCVKCEV